MTILLLCAVFLFLSVAISPLKGNHSSGVQVKKYPNGIPKKLCDPPPPGPRRSAIVTNKLGSPYNSHKDDL